MAWSGRWSDIRLDGGALCLNFTNTVHDRTVDPPRNYLTGFDDLVKWMRMTHALPPGTLRRLQQAADQDPEVAAHTFSMAIAFRESLYNVFSALNRGTRVASSDLALLNEQIKMSMGHQHLVQKDRGFSLDWERNDETLGQILWPVAESAKELLLSDTPGRVKMCPRCRWLFLDTSKNGIRRWCSMDTCGSIDKSLRYYYRRKADAGPGTHR